MGCSSSQPTKSSTAIIKGTLKKHSIQSTTKNPNKFLSQNENYYKNQKPEIPFNDKIFPPNLDSYFGKENGKFIDKNEKRRNNSILPIEIKEENIIFKHYYEIWGNNSDIFYNNNISIEDIKLGQIGDAYFVSVISSLAEFPKLIIQLFKTLKIKKDEPIEINIKIDGKWKVVLLDDYFPINKENNKPIFSDAPNKNLWGVFLEKAWAKINKGYVNILCGYPKEVFEFFTPFPTIPIEISLENKENLWKNICNCDINNCIMTCFIREKNNDLNKYGLICNHCFSLITAKEGIVNKEKVRLLQLRNPFGEGEWNGDYSDSSDKWTSEAKKIFGYENKKNKNDGIFWIDYINFLKFFQIVTFCVPIKNLICSSFIINKDNAKFFNVFKILIEDNGIYIIEINKKIGRIHRKIQPEEEVYENIILVTFDNANKKFIYIGSSFNQSLSIHLKKGEYLCIYNVNYNSIKAPIRKYNVSIYGNGNFKIKQCDSDKDLSLLKKIICDSVENMEKYRKRFTNHKLVLFTGNHFKNTSFGFVYIKNQHDNDIHFKLNIYFKNIISIEGEIPNGVHLKKDEKFVFIGNREVLTTNFQCAANGKLMDNSIQGEVKSNINLNIIDKYFLDVDYDDLKIDYQFDG